MIRNGLRAGVLAILLAAFTTSSLQAETKVRPLPNAHAHNDYNHDRPLLDALSRGFGSIEADVFAVDGVLLVAHDREDVHPERTLEKLYLAPLAERVRSNDGRVYGPPAPPLLLLIDFKSGADETYVALEPLLERYASMLVHDVDGQRQPGAVQVVISGNRPIPAIAADPNRRAYIDGRLPDLERPESAAWMPLISDHWGNHFRWRGRGSLDAEDQAKVSEILSRAHEQGRRVRFWATPDHEAAWRVLHDQGVDLINTDDLAGLANFLNARK
jgi:hypothetical protein